MKIALLVGHGRPSRVLANAVRAWRPNDELLIVLEQPPSMRDMFRYRRRRLGLGRALGQLLFLFCVVPILYHSSKNRIDELMKEHKLDDRSIQRLKPLNVVNVNDAVVSQKLVEFSPDVVLVCGTRILKPDVLACVNAKFVNTHIGVTPFYRGLHGGYWALWNGDPDNFGATVHLVDRGVDTGPPLRQVRVKPTRDDNFFTYPTLQLASALDPLREIVAGFPNSVTANEGEFETGTGRQWYLPTLWQYISGRMRGVR